MYIQEKKQYLRRLRILNISIRQKLNEIEQLESLTQRLTSVVSDMPKTQGNNKKLEDNIAKLIDLEAAVNDEIDDLIAIRQEIEAAIESLPKEDLKIIMRLYYVNGLTWEKVAAEMDYTWRNIHYAHKRALRMIKININW